MNQNSVWYIAIFFICGLANLNIAQAAEGNLKCTKPDLVALDEFVQIGQNVDEVIAGLNQRKVKFTAFSKGRLRPAEEIKLQDVKTLSPIEIYIRSSPEKLKWWQFFTVVEDFEYVMYSFDEHGIFNKKQCGVGRIGP